MLYTIYVSKKVAYRKCGIKMKTKLGNNKQERQLNFFRNYFGLDIDENHSSNNYYQLQGLLNNNEQHGEMTYFVAYECGKTYQSKYDLNSSYLSITLDNSDKKYFFSKGFYCEVTLCVNGNEQKKVWMVSTKNKIGYDHDFKELAKGFDDVWSPEKGDYIQKW